MGKITATDRLIFTLLFSIIIHITVVLGVSFAVTAPPTNQPINNLEITLVKQQTEAPAEEADFLAQANNEGGGETEEKEPEPSKKSPAKAPETKPSPTPAPVESQPVPISQPTPPPVQEAVVEKIIEEKPAPPEIKKVEKPQARPDKAIVQKKAERKIQKVETKEDAQPAPIVKPKKPKISVRDLKLPNQNEIAALLKKFDSTADALSKRPKKRRISAATKEYAAAAYMKGWSDKVERIGNYNYPQEAKRQNINGSLMLTVDINPDGSVAPSGIVVSRSSGYEILDDAAVRIVRLGAPYAAIPDNVLLGNDMLTITRTWKFETSKGLSAR